MDFALRSAKMSRAKRLQVGCVIVKDDNIISYSWNGTPKGWSNYCERNVFASDEAGAWIDVGDIYPFENEFGQRYKLVTLPEVLHAEENALGKLAKGHASSEGATMFCTHSPCIHCSKMIHAAGITTVYYKSLYRDSLGIEFLEKCKVAVIKYK